MASSGEGVGESSSNYLRSVRKSARELMRVALQSKENVALLEDEEQGISDVLSLLKEKQDLLLEKRSWNVELELRQRLSEEPLSDTTLSVEDLQERVGELEREVTAARARCSQDEQLLQRLQSSVVLSEHLFQIPHPSVEDKALRAVVMEQCEVSGEVGRVCGEIGEGEGEVVRIRRERVKCQTKCRDLMAQIEALQREPVSEASTTESASLQRELQLKSAECKLLRGCLQGVIVGSGVDWSEDQSLRDLTISLGHTPSWEQDFHNITHCD